MHAVVLGGTGLIGSAVAERLAALGHRVTVMTRKAPAAPPAGCTWQGGDIVDAAPLRAAFEALRPDAVLHLAAFLQYACEQDPAQAVRVNVDGTLNVLEACRTTGVRRLVFASSQTANARKMHFKRGYLRESIDRDRPMTGGRCCIERHFHRNAQVGRGGDIKAGPHHTQARCIAR